MHWVATQADAGRATRQDCASVILYTAERATQVALDAIQVGHLLAAGAGNGLELAVVENRCQGFLCCGVRKRRGVWGLLHRAAGRSRLFAVALSGSFGTEGTVVI